MSEQKNTQDSIAGPDRPRRRRMWPIVLIVGLIAVGAFAIPRAWAVMGPGWGHHGGCRGELTQETLDRHMDMASNLVLSAIDATDDQRVEVEAVLDGVAPETLRLHEEAEALKEALHDALSADELDTDEIERLRSESVALFDRGTNLALETFVELHDVLTPEQRAQIRDLIEEHH